MNTNLETSATAGNIVRRIREDRGISRSELAGRAGISQRTLFAFEREQNDNIGLATFLRLADALGLTVYIDDGAGKSHKTSRTHVTPENAVPTWDELSDAWRIEGVDA